MTVGHLSESPHATHSPVGRGLPPSGALMGTSAGLLRRRASGAGKNEKEGEQGLGLRGGR
eukprot:CAMPEP_0174292194 /NCGR_PEP_ID=MMETSP0809-20121228/34583_1 /TAXON_ID=73025 ORGANISM="Eutreptiella gymnastica-like, Strain CCMP1594" /NCGR_SAMPLE_ID=MMETSP0809 /ASSEMBLY_ACC=CAM_ASM_000658 /LENGTH=59 /DNA_ID=CAMNT_0015392083 /DNA_START=40 /DNA_END=216 /DNA_ORIENTATION=+